MPEAVDESVLREARVEAARLARAAVAGEVTQAHARAAWPLDEGVDPSVDALAHIYFDHFAWTAKRRAPDEYDVASVLDLADAMAGGDPLDGDVLGGFESVWEVEFDGRHVALVVGAIVFVVYLLIRIG